ncbi:hypothetical protein ILYODFUR_024989, partial [Ilyodon furcidens]
MGKLKGISMQSKCLSKVLFLQRRTAENSQYALQCPTQTEIKGLVYSAATLFFSRLLLCCMLNNANGPKLVSPLLSGLFSSHLPGKNAGDFHILTAVRGFLSETSLTERDCVS